MGGWRPPLSEGKLDQRKEGRRPTKMKNAPEPASGGRFVVEVPSTPVKINDHRRQKPSGSGKVWAAKIRNPETHREYGIQLRVKSQHAESKKMITPKNDLRTHRGTNQTIEYHRKRKLWYRLVGRANSGWQCSSPHKHVRALNRARRRLPVVNT